MMNALLSALAAASVVLSYALYFAYRDAAALRAKLRSTEAALAESEAYRDAVKTAALRGAPLVKWHRDLAEGLPTGADVWYWHLRISGGDILLTDEQYEVAKRRADFLLSSKHHNTK